MRTAVLTVIATATLMAGIAAPAHAAPVSREQYLAGVEKASAAFQKQMKGETVRHTSTIDFMLRAETSLTVNPDDSLIFDIDSLGTKARVICVTDDECWIRRDKKSVYNPLPAGAVTVTREGAPGDQVETDDLPADAIYAVNGNTFTIQAQQNGQQAAGRQTFTTRTYRYSISTTADGLDGSMSGMTKVLPKAVQVTAPPAKKLGPIDRDFTVTLNANTGAYSSKDGAGN